MEAYINSALAFSKNASSTAENRKKFESKDKDKENVFPSF